MNTNNQEFGGIEKEFGVAINATPDIIPLSKKRIILIVTLLVFFVLTCCFNILMSSTNCEETSLNNPRQDLQCVISKIM